MWGIVPAAGRGSRIQPLGFSKELLPVGSRTLNGIERPCAITEHLLERLVLAGADRLCFVISPGKSDIIEYFGADFCGVPIAYVVQQTPVGLCDAVFRATPLVAPDDHVAVGLPDTIWFPPQALAQCPQDVLSFLLFPVELPSAFDAVLLDDACRVLEIRVKHEAPGTRWIWGAFKMPGRVFHQLAALWREPGRRDEYFGTLVNAFLARGGEAIGVKAGTAYADVGTLNGWRHAMKLLEHSSDADTRRKVDLQKGT